MLNSIDFFTVRLLGNLGWHASGVPKNCGMQKFQNLYVCRPFLPSVGHGNAPLWLPNTHKCLRAPAAASAQRPYFPGVCSQPVTEHDRDTKSGPLLGDAGLLWWPALAWSHLDSLVNPSLGCTAVWDASTQPFSSLHHLGSDLHHDGSPAFSISLSIFPHTGISPNKILPCLIPSWCLLLGHKKYTNNKYGNL